VLANPRIAFSIQSIQHITFHVSPPAVRTRGALATTRDALDFFDSTRSR
jgi:hypothetical protein